MNTPPAPSLVRCAIYTRKSTEEGLEQEFNSLHAQRESAEAYIQSQSGQGWRTLPERYDDGGFGGGSLERPALKQLLAEVETGGVDCVVVYKVDRLSRSLLDFARLMDTFEKARVSFVSVTQQFNTTTSLGRLTLNILLSFAQFEREIIGERTRDKMSAARRKGKWTGGVPVLGYDVDPAGKRLRVNPREAEQVRGLFELFSQMGDLGEAVLEINRRGWTTKYWTSKNGRQRLAKPFTQNALLRLLRNVVYIGMVKHNGEVHPGEQPAIVEPALWRSVNERLGRTHRNGTGATGQPVGILDGLIYCGQCRAPMSFSSTGKRRHAYLCQTAQQRGFGSCASLPVSAEDLEASVLAKMDASGFPEGSFRDNGEPRLMLEDKIERVEYHWATRRVAITLRGRDAAPAALPPQEDVWNQSAYRPATEKRASNIR